LSRNFKRTEFACPHCGVALVRPRLEACLEVLRSYRRQPILIVSGYRCPVHNRDVGGAADSQHMYAAAADILPGTCTLDEAQRAGFTGVGTKNGQPVHVDVRDGKFTTWIY
jgi:zinc D-Ala-D-Ala carboxypeptidase